MTKACPICGLDHVAADQTECPQCDADLSCFDALDSIPDEIPQPQAPPIPPPFIAGKGIKPIIIGMVALLLLIAGGIIFSQIYRFRQIESILERQKYDLTNSITRMDKRMEDFVRKAVEQTMKEEDKNKDIQTSEKDEGKKTMDEKAYQSFILPASAFQIYTAKENDTLWDIAKKYYGDGKYYPVLLTHNPHVKIYSVGGGVSMNILLDPNKAKKIYDQIIVEQGGKTFWYYTVAAGDTLSSVAAKFYKPEDVEKLMSEFGDDVQLKPGEKIRILLR